MKRLFIGVILCGGLVLTSGLGFADQNQSKGKTQNTPIVIKGIVLDEMTNKPVRNLGICANADPQEHRVTTTNKRGEFIYPVPSGAAVVEILPYSLNTVGRSTYVNVSEFKNRIITIYSEHGMYLHVHVRDGDGKPIAKASVAWMGAGGSADETDKKGNTVLGKVSRFRNGYLTVQATGYEKWVQSDVYAPLYAKGGLTVTLKKSPPHRTQKQVKQP